MSDQTDELQKHVEDWATAELRGDATFLGSALADAFIGIRPRGFMLTKDRWLERHETGRLRYESFGLDEVAVRSYGDAAVTVCRQTRRGSVRGRERSLRHSPAVPRDAGFREAAGALDAGRPSRGRP